MSAPDELEALSSVLSELENCLSGVNREQIRGAVERIEQADRVFLAGAGRSALAIRGCAMRLMHLGRQAFVVGETTTPSISNRDLLIVGSGSGRTKSLIGFAEKARKIDAQILLLTIDPTSPLADSADHVVRIPASTPKLEGKDAKLASIQPMGSLFEQSLFVILDTLILLLMKRSGEPVERMFGRHANLE